MEHTSHRVPSWIREDGKLEIIRLVWGNRMPSQLWYYLGFVSDVATEQIFEVATQVFVDPLRLVKPQSILFERSGFLPGAPVVIHVVGADVLEVPLEIKCGRTICPLYAVAAQDSPGYINFADPELSEGSRLPE